VGDVVIVVTCKYLWESFWIAQLLLISIAVIYILSGDASGIHAEEYTLFDFESFWAKHNKGWALFFVIGSEDEDGMWKTGLRMMRVRANAWWKNRPYRSVVVWRVSLMLRHLSFESCRIPSLWLYLVSRQYSAFFNLFPTLQISSLWDKSRTAPQSGPRV